MYDHHLIAGCVRWWCSTLSAISDYNSVNLSSPRPGRRARPTATVTVIQRRHW